ncbi:cupin domain-containing protein [bacterium]|nr:cupin domain-containing protein [bacterium]
MGVFPIEQFEKMRPAWSVIAEVGLGLHEAGESIEKHFHDSAEYLFVLEGKILWEMGGETIEVEAGEAIVVETGVEHSLPEVLEPCVILWMRDEAQPPFRRSHVHAPDQPHVPQFYPRRALPSPGRRGHVVDLRGDATFVPELLRRAPGDIVLGTNPCHLSESHARELGQQASKHNQAVAAMLIDLDPATIDTYLMDRTVQKNLTHVNPHNLAVELDLSSAGAAASIASLRKHWLPKLRIANRGVCARFTMREWSDAELATLFTNLHHLPPAEWGVVLDWDVEALRRKPFRLRAAVAAMLPWLRVILCPNEAVEQVAHTVEALGYQGWVARRD